MPLVRKIADAAIAERCLPDWRHSPVVGRFSGSKESRGLEGFDVAGGEVGEQRVLAGPPSRWQVVALRLPAKQVVAQLLLGVNFTLPASTRTKPLEMTRHLCKRHHSGRGLRHRSKVVPGPAAMDRALMGLERSPVGGGSRPSADLCTSPRPVIAEGLLVPIRFRTGAIGSCEAR